MTQKTIKVFIDEIYSKPPKKIYSTNKTDVYHIGNIYSLDIYDLKDYDPEKNRCCRYVLVVIESFSKFGCSVPLKIKNAITITHSFQNILDSSKRRPSLIKSDRGKEI